MSKTVLILKGLPASGKSTWAKEQINEHPGMYKRINKDDLRAMLDNSNWSGANEKFILKIRDEIIIEALKGRKHVIVDDTNLDPSHENRIRELVKTFNSDNNDSVQVTELMFKISVEDAIERDKVRVNSVGAGVIRNMYNKYLKPEFLKLEQDEKLPPAVIVDIDGTIALKGNRSPFDWSKVGLDSPNKPIIKLVNTLHDAGNIIIFVSGRDSICKEETKKWIDTYFPNVAKWKYLLFMRSENDNRKDCIIKKELFENHIRDNYYIEWVLDDRSQTVNTWRNEIGLTTLQCADGDF